MIFLKTITIPLWFFIIVSIPAGIIVLIIALIIITAIYGVFERIFLFFKDKLKNRKRSRINYKERSDD